MNTSDFHRLFWHDGLINGVSYQIGQTGIASRVLSLSLYENNNCPERVTYEIYCLGVGDINMRLSTQDLKQNLFAGNISNGYLKERTLWIYLTDGIIEIPAENFDAKMSGKRVGTE